MKLSFALLILLSALPLWAQAPKPILVDEHGQLPCDDLLGRLDVYFSELSKDPGSIGLVELSTTKEQKLLGIFRHHLMEAHARDRDFTSNRIEFVRTISTETLAVRLWRIPSGATKPALTEVDMTYGLPETIKPMMLRVEYAYADGICPEVDDDTVFAEFLKGNPNSRGNIVVRDLTIERARRKATRIREKFLTQHRISLDRLRFFPRKSSVPTNYLEPVVEYWYLP